MTVLTQRFSNAVEYTRKAHATQFRKGTKIPYVYHLLGVASLVLEYGGNEDQAIAGLLHDVVEDCGEEHKSPIRSEFGDTVAEIVNDCTDGTPKSRAANTTVEAKRQDWYRRKLAYLAHLRTGDVASLLVSGCDKLHNARAILIDLEKPDMGVRVFDRFQIGRDGTLRYYASIGVILTERNAPMAGEFERVVQRIHDFAGQPKQEQLS